MKKLALITALLLATSPVAAQVVTRTTTGTLTGTTTGTSTGTTTGTSTGTTTGVMCVEEMVATFCNVPTAPNTSGYGSSGATGPSAASGSSGGATQSGWQQHVVHSNLPRFSAGERIVQLIKVRDGQRCTAPRPPGASGPRPRRERNETRATRRRVCWIDRQITAARSQSMSMDI